MPNIDLIHEGFCQYFVLSFKTDVPGNGDFVLIGIN